MQKKEKMTAKKSKSGNIKKENTGKNLRWFFK
jgi:hypothetical protein